MKQRHHCKIYLPVRRSVELLAITLFSPVILALTILTALAVRLDSPGGIIFTQNRVGRGGRIFKMFKFRSMRPTAQTADFQLTTCADNRVTRVGRFIRKTRLDELPQFLNILRGEMSLIGPRPVPCELVEKYRREIPDYDLRHEVSPGITGFAQVTQGYTNSTDGEREKWRRDVFYIENLSPALDADIVFRTLRTIAGGFGAR